MYRLLSRHGMMYLNRTKLGTKTTELTRHISLSLGYMKNIQITDDWNDWNDTPTYGDKQLTNRLTRRLFRDFLEQELSCPSKQAAEICLTYPEFSETTLMNVKKNVDFLTLNGVTKPSMVDNPWMLTSLNGSLCSRIRTLLDMKPKNIEDFVPLAILPQTKLIKVKKIAEMEKGIVPSEHRIYHFSKLLDTPPYAISKCIPNRLFLLELPFAYVDERLKIFLKYRTPEEIVRSLSSIRRSTKVIESRLALAKQLNIPSSVSINKTEKCWLKSVKQPIKTQEILGSRSLAEYLAERLSVDINTVENMLEAIPKLRKQNLLLTDQKLDYLLNEARIPASDIALFPYVLLVSTEKMKKRIQELQLNGCSNSRILTLVYLNVDNYRKLLINFKEHRGKQAVNME